jgi:isocitrate dehydrogenase (NAD+)
MLAPRICKLTHAFGIGRTPFYLVSPGDTKTRTVTVLPGIYTGPEVVKSAMRVIEATNAPIKFDVIDNFTMESPEKIKSLEKNEFILLGNLGKAGDRYVDNFAVYKHLDLYVSATHC